MLEQYFRLMRWWLRKWYPVFRLLGRITSQLESIERAIDVTEVTELPSINYGDFRR